MARKEKRPKGAPHNPPTRWDRVLDKAAKKMFGADMQGDAVDRELRKLTEEEGGGR